MVILPTMQRIKLKVETTYPYILGTHCMILFKYSNSGTDPVLLEGIESKSKIQPSVRIRIRFLVVFSFSLRVGSDLGPGLSYECVDPDLILFVSRIRFIFKSRYLGRSSRFKILISWLDPDLVSSRIPTLFFLVFGPGLFWGLLDGPGFIITVGSGFFFYRGSDPGFCLYHRQCSATDLRLKRELRNHLLSRH